MPDNQMTPPGGMPGGMGMSQDDTQEQATDRVVIAIELKTDGTFMVGPEVEGGGMDDANMQPAGSVDEALSIAKELLTGPTPEAAAQGQADLNAGYQSVTGKAPEMPKMRPGAV